MEIPLRIILVAPPPGVSFRLPNSRGELLPPVSRTDDEMAFDLYVTAPVANPDGSPNFRGPFVQGTPTVRFVYINVGTMAGQPHSCWSRRIKVPLGGIGWPLIESGAANPGSRLEARIAGTGRDGTPACATVKLLGTGWSVVNNGGAPCA
jgi:hypothetical protein